MRLSRKELLFLLTITVVSSALRLYRLDELPIGLCADTAYKGVAAGRILRGEHPIFFAENWGGVEPMYMYITAGFIYFLGATPLVIKTVSAVIGVITVPLLYLLARDLFESRTIGALSSSWLAVSYWHLNYSRLGWEIILVPLFVIVTVYLLWRALNSGRWMDFVWVGICMGASLYTYQAARAIPILVIMYMALRMGADRSALRRDGPKLLIALLVAVLAIAPLGGYLATHPDALFRRANNVSIFNPDLNQGSPWRALMTSTAKTIAMFHLLPDPNWRHNPAQRTILDPITGVLFLVGLGITMARFRRPPYLLALVWLVTMPLPAVLTASGLPHSSRSIGLLPLACFLPAIGLHEAIEWVRRRRPTPGIARLTALATVAVLLAVALSTCVDYFTVWDNDELALAFDVPFVQAAEAMNALSDPGGVWVLPLTSLADPDSVHDTVEFLYRGDAPHHFLSTDERTVAEELRSLIRGYQRVWVVEWDQAALGGAYLYHADPKGVLPFLLSKYGVQGHRKEYAAFDVLSYQLSDASSYSIAPVFQTSTARFGDELALTGIAIGSSIRDTGAGLSPVDTPVLSSGGDAWVALKWKALSTPGADYKVATYLVDDRGRALAQIDKVLLSNRLETTSRWKPAQTEQDYYTLTCPPATPPGEYYIEVAVYDGETRARLPVLDEEGRLAGQSKRVSAIQIVQPLVPAQAEPQTYVTDGDLAPGIRLLGYDFARREVEPGGILRWALYWEALEDVSEDYVLSVELRDQAGRVHVQQAERPVDGRYPTFLWDEGEVLVDWHDLSLPPDTSQGEYELFITVVESERVRGGASLGPVAVQGRPHYFTTPVIQHPLQVTVGDNITLLGYDLDRDRVQPGEAVELILYWQVVARMDTSYTVFTHVLDTENRIRGQKDNIPGSGTLPTTGWLEGEVITDVYDLTLDADATPGTYTLEIGMYDATTGQRLPLYDASGAPLGDRLLLDATVSVQ